MSQKIIGGIMENKKSAVDELIEQLKNNEFEKDNHLNGGLVEVLDYFMMIESLVPVTYAPQLRLTPAYLYPSLKKFIDKWELEEAKHGEVLKLYLEKHGHVTKAVSERKQSFKYYRGMIWTVLLSWPLWYIYLPTYLVIGGINEATTSAGYWALMNIMKDYPLLVKIVKAIQDEEVKHLNVYKKKSEKFLKSKWRRMLTLIAVKRNWKPIGFRHGDSSNLASLLLSDETEDGFFHRLGNYLKGVNKPLKEDTDEEKGVIQIREWVLNTIRALKPS